MNEEDVCQITNKLPWFVSRMMCDAWAFGIQLVSGEVIGIECIDRFTKDFNGDIWIDVSLLDKAQCHDAVRNYGYKMFHPASNERRNASIRCSQIAMAFELWDT